MKLTASNHSSPLGDLLLLATERGLRGVWFHGQRHFPETDPGWHWDDAPFAATHHVLDDYFAGRREMIRPPLDMYGTPFQKKVWSVLCDIPAGQTRSYGEIARAIGAPSAVRAVGGAIGRNPVSILVPCHRVVGGGGKLTGYAGGLDRKKWLLAHESAIHPQLPRMAP